MTAKKPYCTHDGRAYVSVPQAARLIGTSAAKLKEIAIAEGLQFQNFRTNGRLWISVDDINAYLARHAAFPAVPGGSARPTKIHISSKTDI